MTYEPVPAMTAIAVVVVPFVEAVSRDPGKSQVTGITRSENSGVFHFEFRLFFREEELQVDTTVRKLRAESRSKPENCVVWIPTV